MNHGTVLVTGGAKRIGKAISLKLSSDGYSIAIHYNKSSKDALELVQIIRSNGGIADAFEADLNDSEAVSRLVPKINSTMGKIIGIVNNASLFSFDDLLSLSDDSWTKHMNINAKAPILLIRELYNLNDGLTQSSVVNILDQKIVNPNPDYLSYTASKFTLLGLTDTLARGLAPKVRVNAVAPGHTIASPEQSNVGFSKSQSQTPLGIGPNPEDIANSVSYLMQARSVTGQIIFVDSGERFLSRKRDVVFETES
jgi:NAD(P)-dependent dehydrogenase (short-subunit alcohol dehydrogenase family)